jgi:hypothetical protein
MSLKLETAPGSTYLTMTGTIDINPEADPAEFDDLPDKFNVYVYMDAEDPRFTENYNGGKYYSPISGRINRIWYKDSLPESFNFVYSERVELQVKTPTDYGTHVTSDPAEPTGEWLCRFKFGIENGVNALTDVHQFGSGLYYLAWNGARGWGKPLSIGYNADVIPFGEDELVSSIPEMYWDFEDNKLSILGSKMLLDIFNGPPDNIYSQVYNRLPSGIKMQCLISGKSTDSAWEHSFTKSYITSKRQINDNYRNGVDTLKEWKAELAGDVLVGIPIDEALNWIFHYTITDTATDVVHYDFYSLFKTDPLNTKSSAQRIIFTEVENEATLTDPITEEEITVTKYGDFIRTSESFDVCKVYNLTGRLVKQINLKTVVPVNDLEPGIYLFYFKFQPGEIVKKFYIQ